LSIERPHVVLAKARTHNHRIAFCEERQPSHSID
jgi:hypothetical protein